MMEMVLAEVAEVERPLVAELERLGGIQLVRLYRAVADFTVVAFAEASAGECGGTVEWDFLKRKARRKVRVFGRKIDNVS